MRHRLVTKLVLAAITGVLIAWTFVYVVADLAEKAINR